MARVKLSEHKAKSLLINNYRGVSLTLDNLASDVAKLDEATRYIIKVDQGVKKRAKQGLIRLDIHRRDAETAIQELAQKDFSKFIAEPMLNYQPEDEHYVSFERSRDGIIMNYSPKGGVDIEEYSETIETFLLPTDQNLPLASEFIKYVLSVMDNEHFSFVEINPLVIRDNEYHLLDAAVLVDSAGGYQASWQDHDIAQTDKHPAETAIRELNASSPASFMLRILEPDGSLWLLLSGGGASITIADEAANLGQAHLIGNYGEYSGGPTTEETYLYARQVLSCLLASKAEKKALVIAGGVANFTDVRKTFNGIIRAFEEVLEDCQRQNIKVFVRRGGPHEADGLAIMKRFLEKNNLFGSVHGSDAVLTIAAHEALEYIDA